MRNQQILKINIEIKMLGGYRVDEPVEIKREIHVIVGQST